MWPNRQGGTHYIPRWCNFSLWYLILSLWSIRFECSGHTCGGVRSWCRNYKPQLNIQRIWTCFISEANLPLANTKLVQGNFFFFGNSVGAFIGFKKSIICNLADPSQSICTFYPTKWPHDVQVTNCLYCNFFACLYRANEIICIGIFLTLSNTFQQYIFVSNKIFQGQL